MKIETLLLGKNGWVPNNERLPVVIYRGALNGENQGVNMDKGEGRGEGLAEQFEALFNEHQWPPSWRDGVFDYHHYHSTSHEALGVFAGSATLELGGPDGQRVTIGAGDAVMLPAGTGHRAVAASADFAVVGAYPAGCTWDICREAPDDATHARIEALPDPRSDPVTGETGTRTGA